MQAEPLWSQCLHLMAGTCPQLWLEGGPLCGDDANPRAELSQDLALMRLSGNCASCLLQPKRDDR
jgi:hypothetical protein